MELSQCIAVTWWPSQEEVIISLSPNVDEAFRQYVRERAEDIIFSVFGIPKRFIFAPGMNTNDAD